MKPLSANLEWDVTEQPLLTASGIQTNRKMLIRTDNHFPLGIVGENYQVFHNETLMKLCVSIEKSGKFKLEGFDEFRGGKIVMAFLRNLDDKLKIGGLQLNEYLVIGNSFDMSRKFTIGTSHTLIRCQNQFTASQPISKFWHREGIKISEGTIKAINETYELSRKKIFEDIESLKRKSVSRQLCDDLVVYLLRTDRNLNNKNSVSEILALPKAKVLRNCIERETEALGNNAFGLFNGVTWYTSHEMNAASRNFGSSNGQSFEMNTKALRFCLNI